MSFDAANTNRAGKLSYSELQFANPLLAKYFDPIDTRHCGYLTKEDIRAAMLEKMQNPADQ
ncbi:hypothetical protein [Burkholderia cenocepacia]|uniref:hypothetical protein n=1 Tax=Burkholderia cenocepacia TaxID=95486 RepID=UPI002AB5EEA9|nr:hypothetical protein [Burkholderia cenocepacia]